MKKILSLILLALLPIVANAYDAEIDGIYYNLIDKAKIAEVIPGDFTFPSEDCNIPMGLYSGDIVIPEFVTYEGIRYSVTSIKDGNYGYNGPGCWGAFFNCYNLTSVSIPNSVTHIGDGAFQGCNHLTTIKIGNGVKSIGDYAFYDCSSLTSIILPNGVTSIGDYAFGYCTSLTSITIPESVTSIGQDAFGFASLQYNEYGNADYIGNDDNPYLVLIKPQTDNITTCDINEKCKFINSGAFNNCRNLTSITIPNSMTSIGNEAFANCPELSDVYCFAKEVPSTSSYDIFHDSLIEYATLHVLSSAIEQYKSQFPWYGFGSIIPLNYINGIYYNFNGNEVEVTYQKYQNWNYISDYSGSVIIPEYITCNGKTYSVTSISEYAFYGCSGLTSVTIPNSVTSIGDCAFLDCIGLTSVTIGNNVTSIGDGAFNSCTGLTSVIIPNSVTSIGCGAFTGCSGLTSVTIPNNVTDIGERAFEGCSGLTSVTISNSLTSIDEYTFSGCSDLTSVTIPNSVTSIGEGAFYDCHSLKKVIVPDIVAWCSITFGDASANPLIFAQHLYSDEYTEIKDLVIPDEVTIISNYAFSGCSGLTSVIIPNSVTSIGDYAFCVCTSLTSITIPENVTSIGSHAFYDCYKQKDVYCYAKEVPNTNNDVFEGSHIEYATLHVPASALDAYKETYPWSEFGKIVKLDDVEPVERCATPTISYKNGQLSFESETEGVKFKASIRDTDIKDYSASVINLSATYTITVYATKDGYENSEVATGTLCWIDMAPQTEGIVNEDAVMELKAMPVLIQSQGGTISIQGAAEGTPIAVYDIEGKQYGSTIAEKDYATITTSLRPGSIAVVKIGEKAVKVAIK
ncbi:MAG: leucine-rich repeat domain-containing protein [Bacteroidaceae bacterium]|nr:leucine-rich repeat domain-containing protein [Bacteroidaceae bacterium]